MSQRRRVCAGAISAILAVAIFSVYGQTLDHEFVLYDDPIFFTENPSLEQGLSAEGVSWAFTSMRAANWFPMTRLSLLLDTELHGGSPAGVHATNVLLHAASAILLFLALLRMTGRLLPSAFVAGVFALHPLQVESVAWASERKGLLAGFFWMAALWVYAGTARGTLTPGRGVAVGTLFACGLASKLVLATLPFVLLLLDYWPLARITAEPGSSEPGRVPAIDPAKLRRALLEKLPLALLVLGALALVFEAQSRGGAVASLDQVPVGWRLANAAVSYARYVSLFLWPTELAVFHPHPGASLSGGVIALSVAGLAIATAAALWQARRQPARIVGWLWFLGTLVPMIGIVHLGSQSLAERYAYVPLVGLSLIVGFGARTPSSLRPGTRKLAVAAGMAVLLALGVASHRQAAVWRDTETLFRHALHVTENNHVAHQHLGHALLAAGRDAEAIASYRAALVIHGTDAGALNNLAWLLATHPDPALRDAEDAVRLAGEAVRLTGGADPTALDTLAAAYGAAERFDLAVLTAGKAKRIAQHEQPGLAATIDERLALYREHHGYREPPALPGHPFDAPK